MAARNGLQANMRSIDWFLATFGLAYVLLLLSILESYEFLSRRYWVDEYSSLVFIHNSKVAVSILLTILGGPIWAMYGVLVYIVGIFSLFRGTDLTEPEM